MRLGGKRGNFEEGAVMSVDRLGCERVGAFWAGQGVRIPPAAVALTLVFRGPKSVLIITGKKHESLR